MSPAGRYEIQLGRLRLPSGLMLAAGLVLAHLPSGVGLPCPLRTLTGVPCPFCGLTTSVRSTLGGHLGEALRAAPLGLPVVAAAVLAVSGRGPRVLRVPYPLVVATLASEWVYELFRFHVL